MDQTGSLNSSVGAALRCSLALLVVSFLGAEAVAQTCVEPSPDIVAWWPFDETSGASSEDIAGINNGLHVNGPSPTAGVVDGSLRFDGVNDYVVVPDSDLWAFGTSEFTIEFWANFDVPAQGTTGHPGDVFISNDEGPFLNNKWFFALASTHLEFLTATGGVGEAFAPIAPFSPETDRWYHLAVTRSGTSYRIYVDGALAAADASFADMSDPDAVLTIGRALEPFGGFMSGRLDEMTIYHRALAGTELLDIFQAGGAGKCKDVTIQTPALSALQLSVEFSQQLEAAGGVPPYSWSVAVGTLPPGMSLDVDGVFSGTPTELGRHDFSVEVTDGAGDNDRRDFTVDVLLVAPPPDLRIFKAGTLPVPGRTVDYFLLIENAGAVAARDIEVAEPLNPREVSLLSVSPAAVADVPTLEDAAFIIWLIPELGPGESTLLAYQVELLASVPLGTLISGGPACSGTQLTPGWQECLEDAFTTTADCALCAAECSALASSCGTFCAIPTVPTLATCLVCLAPCADCLFLGIQTGGTGGCVHSVGGVIDCFADQARGSESQSECSRHDEPATGPVDPNEKEVLASTFIGPDQLLVYPIHFENVGEVEAIDVFVTDVLDPSLDDSTLELLSPDGSYDPATRTVRFDLLGINLPPVPAPGEQGGTGNVLFSVKPLPGLPSGTEIRNSAEIQFEIFEPLVTPEVVNIIDTTAPECVMDALPGQMFAEEFEISWSGSEAVGEIESFTVFVAQDGGPFTLVVETDETSASLVGEAGSTYGLFCVAKDTVGNVEEQELAPETTTVVTPFLAVEIDVKPGSYPNSVNPGARGRIPVAVLTTPSFDAALVAPLSVRFGPLGAAESHGQGHLEDADDDGDIDLVLHFKVQDTGIVCGDTSVTLVGSTFEGQPIEGSDSISTVSCE